jgi:signal transduction histidine kinase
VSLKKCIRHVPPRSVLPLGIAVSSFLIDLKIPNDVPDAFLYVLAVLSCAWVPCPNAAFYTALGLMLFVVLGSLASPPVSPAWVALVNRLFGAVLVWLVAVVVWRNARLIRDRNRTLCQLERLSRASERAANTERIELSRWLHEGLAQELAVVGWGLDRLASHSADERKVGADAVELRTVVDGALRRVHRKAVELRKREAASDRLAVLVERYVRDFIGRTGLSVEIKNGQCLEGIPATYTILGLTLVQEALTNIVRHAVATRVHIECREEARGVRVTISDDGQGIDSDARLKPDSLGLLGLHERLTAVGGELEISNVEPHGVRVDALFPIR